MKTVGVHTTHRHTYRNKKHEHDFHQILRYSGEGKLRNVLPARKSASVHRNGCLQNSHFLLKTLSRLLFKTQDFYFFCQKEMKYQNWSGQPSLVLFLSCTYDSFLKNICRIMLLLLLPFFLGYYIYRNYFSQFLFATQHSKKNGGKSSRILIKNICAEA